MYDSYVGFVKSLLSENLSSSDFKSNKRYCSILEHVSFDLGQKYLNLIQNEFTWILYENIKDFTSLNDKYGKPVQYTYTVGDNNLICSPTSLRYVYHALVILEYYKNSGCENVVEVGCGYGGLCLAIFFFSKLTNVTLKNYHIVDLPEICELIKKYVNNTQQSSHYSTIHFHHSTTYGGDISDKKLFLISNYCYTELAVSHNRKYSSILLPKTEKGFFVWQNGGNSGSYPVEKANEITGKVIVNCIEEKPQTDAGYGIYKNYFLYF